MKNFRSIIFIGALAAAFMLTSCGRNEPAQEEVISKKIKIAEDIPADGAGEQTAPPEAPASSVAAPEVTATEAPKTVQETTQRPAVTKPEPAAEPPKEEKEKKTIKIDVKEKEPAPPKEERKEVAQEKEIKKVKAAKKPVKKKAVAAKPAPKIWAINVASFKNLKDAQDMTTSLKLAGYNAYITPFTKNGVGWQRVRVGFFRTRDEAEKAGASVKKRFRIETPWVVKAARAEASEHAE